MATFNIFSRNTSRSLLLGSVCSLVWLSGPQWAHARDLMPEKPSVEVNLSALRALQPAQYQPVKPVPVVPSSVAAWQKPYAPMVEAPVAVAVPPAQRRVPVEQPQVVAREAKPMAAPYSRAPKAESPALPIKTSPKMAAAVKPVEKPAAVKPPPTVIAAVPALAPAMIPPASSFKAQMAEPQNLPAALVLPKVEPKLVAVESAKPTIMPVAALDTVPVLAPLKATEITKPEVKPQPVVASLPVLQPLPLPSPVTVKPTSAAAVKSAEPAPSLAPLPDLPAVKAKEVVKETKEIPKSTFKLPPPPLPLANPISAAPMMVQVPKVEPLLPPSVTARMDKMYHATTPQQGIVSDVKIIKNPANEKVKEMAETAKIPVPETAMKLPTNSTDQKSLPPLSAATIAPQLETVKPAAAGIASKPLELPKVVEPVKAEAIAPVPLPTKFADFGKSADGKAPVTPAIVPEKLPPAELPVPPVKEVEHAPIKLAKTEIATVPKLESKVQNIPALPELPKPPVVEPLKKEPELTKAAEPAKIPNLLKLPEVATKPALPPLTAIIGDKPPSSAEVVQPKDSIDAKPLVSAGVPAASSTLPKFPVDSASTVKTNASPILPLPATKTKPVAEKPVEVKAAPVAKPLAVTAKPTIVAEATVPPVPSTPTTKAVVAPAALPLPPIDTIKPLEAAKSTTAPLPPLPTLPLPPVGNAKVADGAKLPVATDSKAAGKPEIAADKSAAPASTTTAPTESKLSRSLSYDKGKSDLSTDAKSDLTDIADQLKQSQGTVRVVSYASGTVEEASIAKRTSLARALQIRAYLIDKGVNPLNIITQAMGNKVPSGDSDRADIFVK